MTTITCAACGRTILTVSDVAADAFSSGAWMCGDVECLRQRQAASALAAGRLL